MRPAGPARRRSPRARPRRSLSQRRQRTPRSPRRPSPARGPARRVRRLVPLGTDRGACGRACGRVRSAGRAHLYAEGGDSVGGLGPRGVARPDEAHRHGSPQPLPACGAARAQRRRRAGRSAPGERRRRGRWRGQGPGGRGRRPSRWRRRPGPLRSRAANEATGARGWRHSPPAGAAPAKARRRGEGRGVSTQYEGVWRGTAGGAPPRSAWLRTKPGRGRTATAEAAP